MGREMFAMFDNGKLETFREFSKMEHDTKRFSTKSH